MLLSLKHQNVTSPEQGRCIRETITMHVQRFVCGYCMTDDLLAVEFELPHFSLAEIQPHLGTADDNSLYDCYPPTPDQEAILRKTNALPDLDRETLSYFLESARGTPCLSGCNLQIENNILQSRHPCLITIPPAAGQVRLRETHR